MTDDDSKPNLVVPMVPAFNDRGSSGEDQTKINCYYQQYVNHATGNKAVMLTKRPGVNAISGTFGSGTQVPTLVTKAPLGYSNGWLITGTGTVKAHDGSTTTSIHVGGAGTYPMYWDLTRISGTETVVLQISDGTGPRYAYYSSAIGTWTQITDTDFTTTADAFEFIGKMEHLDGFAFQMDLRGRIQNSDLNSISSWPPIATATIRKAPTKDTPQGLARLNKQLLGFGSHTCEVFVNNGNPTGSPLISVARHEVGLHNYHIASGSYTAGSVSFSTRTNVGHYYTALGGFIYFVGRAAGDIFDLGVYSYNGESFEKISNPSVDRLLGLSTTIVYSINTVSVFGADAVSFLLTSPNSSSHAWLMYFPEHREWFRWESSVISPINWRGIFCGITNSTALYKFSEGTQDWDDAGSSFTMQVDFKVPKRGNGWDSMLWCALDADTTSATSAVTVAVADDGLNNSYTTKGTIDLADQRKILPRMGAYRERQVRLTNSANEQFRIRNFLARVE